MPIYIVCLEAIATVRTRTAVDAADLNEATEKAKIQSEAKLWVGVNGFRSMRATKIVNYDTGEKLYEEQGE